MSKKLGVGVDFGDYRVVRLLGASGNVDVYLMRSMTTGGLYAMKLFMPPDGITQESQRRFSASMNEAMAVRSENVVQIHDFGQDPDTGLFYLVMDYADGGTLAEYMAMNGAFDIKEALNTAIVALRALESIHGAGLFHGDIKPSNIMFMQDGTLKLSDLGISKVSPVVQANSAADASSSNGISSYVAPELVMHGSAVDGRADIFSIGVTLVEMLTGKRLDAYATMLDVIVKATNNALVPDVRTLRGDIPEIVALAVSKLCAVKAGDRPQTAGAAAELLSAALRAIGGADEPVPDVAARAKRKKVLKVRRKTAQYGTRTSCDFDGGDEERHVGGKLLRMFFFLLAIAIAIGGVVYSQKRNGANGVTDQEQMPENAEPPSAAEGANDVLPEIETVESAVPSVDEGSMLKPAETPPPAEEETKKAPEKAAPDCIEITREWRDFKGRTRTATLVGIAENGAVAILRNPGEDRVRSLTIAKLCKEDRDVVNAIADKLRKYVKRNGHYVIEQ